jgi:sirohydrochlorin cobaltochelatase
MNPPQPSCHGLILFAHGARDARWSAPFEAVAAQVRSARPGCRLRLAFLEFMSPSLAEAAAALAVEGCEQIDVLPLFLGTGGHLRKDLPLLMDALRAQHPGLQFSLHPAVGEASAVTAAMASVAATLLPIGLEAGAP